MTWATTEASSKLINGSDNPFNTSVLNTLKGKKMN